MQQEAPERLTTGAFLYFIPLPASAVTLREACIAGQRGTLGLFVPLKTMYNPTG